MRRTANTRSRSRKMTDDASILNNAWSYANSSLNSVALCFLCAHDVATKVSCVWS